MLSHRFYTHCSCSSNDKTLTFVANYRKSTRHSQEALDWGVKGKKERKCLKKKFEITSVGVTLP
jgi:hypothetical protein